MSRLVMLALSLAARDAFRTGAAGSPTRTAARQRDKDRDGPVASFSAVCSRFARERRPSLHLLAATLMVSPNSSGRGDFARGLYVENDLPSRR